jgi:hypothetical protein
VTVVAERKVTAMPTMLNKKRGGYYLADSDEEQNEILIEKGYEPEKVSV